MPVSAVRLRPAMMAGFLCLLLSACMAPLLAGPQSQLMWALLKPMVGLDPNEADLFEQPLVKNRMQPLLGEHYETTVALLKTANQIQQEGPLFYVMSKTPATQALADQARITSYNVCYTKLLRKGLGIEQPLHRTRPGGRGHTCRPGDGFGKHLLLALLLQQHRHLVVLGVPDKAGLIRQRLCGRGLGHHIRNNFV